MVAIRCVSFKPHCCVLENIIEHSFVLCQGRVIERKDLPDTFRASEAPGKGEGSTLRTLKQMEAMMIEQALRRHNGNRAAAARELDINPSTLFRKLRTLGLDA